jgi:hypothetical protein
MKLRLILALWLTGAVLLAQEEEKPAFSSDRPGQSFSSVILPQGSVLWQQGFEWTDFYIGGGEELIFVTQRNLASQTGVRVGLGYNIEAGLAYNLEGINNPTFNDEYVWTGSNPALMLRYQLPSGQDYFTWAFIVQSSFDNLDYRLSASLQDGPWSVGGNLGFAHDEVESFKAQWTVILGYSKEWYSAFAEVYGLSLSSANRDFLAFDAGFAFLINPDFQWEIYAGNRLSVGPAVGLNKNYFLNTGFTWRLR